MVVVGETVVEAAVTPVLQIKDIASGEEAVKVAEAPAQMMPSLPAVPEFSITEIETVGSGSTVMTCVAVAEQPFAFVTVTV